MHARTVLASAVCLALGAAALGRPALAGARWIAPAAILPASRMAYGSFGSIRNSPETVAWMKTVVHSDASVRFATFYMKDASGQEAYCYTYAAAIVDGLAAAPSDAYLWVSWDTAGVCTAVEAHSLSALPAKAI